MSQPDKSTIMALARKAAIGGAVGIGAVALPVVVLSVAGFSSVGVIPGSMAAVWQSSIGNVVGGSLFAACQSAGAAGLTLTTMTTIGAVGFISTNAMTVARGSVHGIRILGSGLSSSSKFMYGIVKSKL